MSAELVLFDLDGTLMDTAPDMGASLNILRAEHNLPPLTADRIRPQVSHGAMGLLKLGFGIEPQDARFSEMRSRYLDIYEQHLAEETKLFHGMAEVLDGLEAAGLTWGIVTNKPGWLTDPLLDHLGLSTRAGCVVSGDTVAERKPHPLPLLHAAGLIRVAPGSCVYVGDAERDIQAGRAAGMRTVVAAYGYLGDGDSPASWNATGIIDHPQQLLSWVDGVEVRQ